MVDNILLYCEYTNMLWAKCMSLFNLNLDMTIRDDVWSRAHVGSETRGLELLIVAAIYWHIWKECNNRILKNLARSITHIWFFLYVILYVG